MKNFLSKAGQAISRLPGFFFILNRLSQAGHSISTLGILGVTVN